MNDQTSRSTRLRYTAAGALAAFAVAGAIAGTAALAAKPPANPHRHAATDCAANKTPASDKGEPAPPSPTPKVFFDTVQRLVDDGTITAAQGQTLDREIRAGHIDEDTLTGFTQAQLQAVQQALANAKRGLATAAHQTSG